MPVSETTDLIYDVTLHGLAWLLRSVNRGPAVFAPYRMPNDCVLMLTADILHSDRLQQAAHEVHVVSTSFFI